MVAIKAKLDLNTDPPDLQDASNSKPLRLRAGAAPADADACAAAATPTSTALQRTEMVLIPGLPPSLAYKCLARVPKESHSSMIQVCRAWRSALLSGPLFTLRKHLGASSCMDQVPWIYLAFCPNVKLLRKSKCKLPYTTWLEAYDPSLNLWHNLGPFPGLLPHHTLKDFAFVSLGDKLYVIGGMHIPNHVAYDNDNNATTNGMATSLQVIRKEVLVYNCTTREWSTCASMSTPRVDFACTICKGCIYVAGGRTHSGQEKGVSSAEFYMPEADCWVALPGMSTKRYKCVGVTSDDRIHIIGGFAGPEESDPMIQPSTIKRSSVDVFHPHNGQWTLLMGMWQLDIPPKQIVSVEDRLYSSGDALNEWKGRIEEYDKELNMWKVVEGSWLPMSHPEECHKSERCYLTMAPIGHYLFFLGGYRLPSDLKSTSLHTVYIFDTTARDAASQWKLLEPMQDRCKELCSNCCVVYL
ncbi:hypothetical protein GOP47_0007384 [Adiantum capillus-veneris]|uniref:F-box/kelch-repeat protein n=1 Tax=Adiantum capillus-veneris TaxID=13818 RepID=A0A9D4ZLV5_ADICA|nr:hypothetical protein GOP47_0007384 [Adiantum capillus-veneris]